MDVSRTIRDPANYVVSSSSGSFTTTSSSAVDVTNLSVSITTATTRPIMLQLIGDGTNIASIGVSSTGGGSQFSVLFLRGSTVISEHNYSDGGEVSSFSRAFSPSTFKHIDIPSPGTYTYKIQTYRGSAGLTINFEDVKLVVVEL